MLILKKTDVNSGGINVYKSLNTIFVDILPFGHYYYGANHPTSPKSNCAYGFNSFHRFLTVFKPYTPLPCLCGMLFRLKYRRYGQKRPPI